MMYEISFYLLPSLSRSPQGPKYLCLLPLFSFVKSLFERKKFKIEHTNNFSILENQYDSGFDIKIEPSPLGQFKKLLEPSSLG